MARSFISYPILHWIVPVCASDLPRSTAFVDCPTYTFSALQIARIKSEDSQFAQIVSEEAFGLEFLGGKDFTRRIILLINHSILYNVGFSAGINQRSKITKFGIVKYSSRDFLLLIN